MLQSRRKAFQLAPHCLNRLVRSASTSQSAAPTEQEWKNAKPFSDVPGPKTFEFIRAFLPGGKYANLTVIDLSNKMQEEYGSLSKFPGLLGQRDMVFTFDPNDIETIFRNEGKFPARRGLDTLEYFRNVYRKEWFEKGTGLVPSQGQDWYEFRTKVNQTMMQPKTAKLYIPKVDEVVTELVTKMKKNRNAQNETPADFLEYLNTWALESIGIITLDKRLGVMENSATSEVNQLLKEVSKFSYEHDILPNVWRTFKTKKFLAGMKVYDKVTGTLKVYAEEAMAKLQATAQNTLDHEAGVLEKLMKIDKHVAFVMVLDSLLAGIDTTSTAAVSVLYQLAKNPDKQEILRQEILKALPDKSSKLSTTSLANLPYLRAVIKEGLRIQPPVSANAREAGVDLVIQGYQIPKGTTMVLWNHVISMEEKHFERAKEFIPERWLKDNTDAKCPHAKDSHPFAYLPFGFGPRMCVGRRFAELEIEILVSRLIREFQIEWKQPDLKFKSYTFNIAADPLKFTITDLKY